MTVVTVASVFGLRAFWYASVILVDLSLSRGSRNASMDRSPLTFMMAPSTSVAESRTDATESLNFSIKSVIKGLAEGFGMPLLGRVRKDRARN